MTHQPFTPSLASIVKKIEEANTFDEQVTLLQKNSSAALKAILGFGLNPNVKWLVPQGTPPFKASEEIDNEGRFYNETKKLIHFIAREGQTLTKSKREQLFINIMETVHPDDARLLVRIKDRQLTIRIDAVKKAFPTLTKDWA